MLSRRIALKLAPVGMLALGGLIGCNAHRCNNGATYYEQPNNYQPDGHNYDGQYYEPNLEGLAPAPPPPETNGNGNQPPAPALAPPAAPDSNQSANRYETPGYVNPSGQYSTNQSIPPAPVSEPVESQNQYVPQIEQPPNMFQRFGSGLKNLYNLSRRRTSIRRTSMIQTSSNASVQQTALTPSPDPNMQQPEYASQSIQQSSAQTVPTKQSPVAFDFSQSSTQSSVPSSWEDRLPRQGYPSANRIPLMNVPQSENQIEMWPHHVQP